MGPVEFLVLAFPGDTAGATVLDPLERLRRDGSVRVLAVRELRRDRVGALVAQADAAGLITDEDVAEARDLLGPGESAVLLLVEHLWAAELTAAFQAARGRVAASVRVAAAEG